ncbi:MAG: DUF3821 domain-containing protein [Methanomicrobiales archaeon]|nr:DUF3821 domain-containing protein [Methanomicrobiales archaeon]
MILAVPSTARTGSIQVIDNADTIFIYEENLDISALRLGANPVTFLRKFVDDNPGKAVIKEIPVPDDTSFTVYASSVGTDVGIYYAYNPTDGNTGKYVRINEPTVAIDAVLANPYHTDSIRGLNIPDTTAIAFKITSPNVGASYHLGTVFPATVDIVVTTPGGGELSIFQGRDFRGLNISSTEFYTDDPGEPGAFTFQGLSEGTYQAQARWSNPESFDSQAPDSNILTWNIGGTPTPTPTPTTPPSTTTPTTPPTTTVTGTPTQTVTTTEATTAPPVTTPGTTPSTTEPGPTPTPLEPVAALGAVALLALVLGRRAP